MNYKRLFIPNSFVFITIVTSKRRHILIDNILLFKKALKITMDKYNYQISAICVLPDHVHMIIKPYEIQDYPTIVKQIKTYFSKNIDISKIKDYNLSNSKISKGECDIWQRRYYEHTINSEQDLYKHIDYIHYNPYKHEYVTSVKQWKYSSFHKFVLLNLYDENWMNFEDKNHINNMDLD